jgi:GTP-binding protein YchF
MQLGIIGLPLSGKTTLFNAVTHGTRPTGRSSAKLEIHTAVVDVPDARVDQLTEMFRPKRTIYAKITYLDFAGLEGGRETIAGPLLNQLAQMDGLVHVVRCFEDESVPHPLGSIDPERDISLMDSELLLNDLVSVERRLERLNEERHKGGVKDKAAADREVALFGRLKEALESEVPLRDLSFEDEELTLLSGFGLLTLKPVLVVLNEGEDQSAPAIPYEHARSQVIALKGNLEMEIAQLPPDEASAFLEEYGIAEPVLNRVIRLSYELLGLQSFLTAGEDEVRAWTVHRGALAPEAAGVIHSDMQKGFIRAEVVSYDDLMTLGTMAEARAKGKLRLEGKDYAVQDGDILNIRFTS